MSSEPLPESPPQGEPVLDELFATAPLALQVLRLSGSSLHANRAFERLFGRLPANDDNFFENPYAARHGLVDLVQRAFGGAVARRSLLVLRSATQGHEQPLYAGLIEVPDRVAAGEEKRTVLEATAFPITDANGEVNHVGLAFRARSATAPASETAPKSTGERLRQNEKRWRALVENLTDAIKLTARDGEILYASPSTERVTGYDAEECVGRNLFEFIHPDDRESVEARFKECLEKPGVVVKSLARFRHKDGSYRYVESVRVNRLDDPDIGAVVTNYRDVTDRKTLEEQVQQSQKMEAIGRLAGGIAHDFNNMLTVIVSLSRMMMSELEPGDRMAPDLEEISKAAERATVLTRQLLAFGRKQVLKPIVLDLSEQVREMESMLRRVIGEDVAFETVLSPNLGAARVDPGQLEQVLLNLVVNARDAMPNGGKLVIETANVFLDKEYVGNRVDLASGPYVMLSVSDNGLGMDKAVMARVFEPFFTTKEAGRGTGLGLATVFGIVKQSGAHIEVESEVNAGATFRIYFPKSEEKLGGRAERQPRVAGLGGRETILLVEDDPLVRKVAQRALKRHGYRVLEASNGGEALLLLEQQPDDAIDLLIVDLVMPRMNGRKVAERMVQLRPKMRLLFMSGYDNDATREDMRALGGDFVEKPLAPEPLLRKVREILDRSE